MSTDKNLYRVWSTNPGVLNLEFLREEREPTLARWKVWLEQEAEDTVTEAVSGSDESEEVESTDLKTSQVRLAVLRGVVHEAFQEVPPAEPKIPASASIDKPSVEDAPPAKDVALCFLYFSLYHCKYLTKALVAETIFFGYVIV